MVGRLVKARGGSVAKSPRVAGEFVCIYRPHGDVFPGPSTENLTAGHWYDDWIANDHSLIQDRHGRWHGFGITGPASPIVHEAEWMAFHIVSTAGSLSQAVERVPWQEHPKVLPPLERPDERRELWAPFVVERSGRYFMFYGPTDMRVATSTDLFTWQPCGASFSQSGAARDPWITSINSTYHMVYVGGRSIYLKTSSDLWHWSEPAIEIFRMKVPGVPESPMLVQYGEAFYLFWTVYDGENGSYDNRTHVLRAETPCDFQQAEALPGITAHCPELIQDGDQWFITSAEWPHRGVSIARIDWV
jgi:arabinan endo-1,5-alpha-L-arabinosidase